jgi:hypothetical protein
MKKRITLTSTPKTLLPRGNWSFVALKVVSGTALLDFTPDDGVDLTADNAITWTEESGVLPALSGQMPNDLLGDGIKASSADGAVVVIQYR